MAEPHTARIRLDADGRGTVEVDGQDLSHATRGLSLHASVDARPQLLLDLRIDTSEITAEDIDIHIPAASYSALVALGWTPPPRLVKVEGVMTEGGAETAREALRQMHADPHGLEQGWAVRPYTDHGSPRYVFRCWGTDGGCEGLVSLDHTTRASAESARDRHLAEAHQPADGTPR